MALFTDDISINTIIGASSAVSGDIRVNGIVRIEGDVDGNVEATGNVFVGEKARVRGNITAGSAEVCGIVLGDISAPRGIRLLASSAVLGDLFTNRLQIEDKAAFHGHCIALKAGEAYDEAAREYAERRAIRSRAV